MFRAASFHTIEVNIRWRQKIASDYVATQLIMDLCLHIEYPAGGWMDVEKVVVSGGPLP